MRTGIIGAMDVEIAAILEEMELSKKTELSMRVFYEGRFAGKDVVVVQSGIGKVNAAITAQILCDRFDCGAIINVGIAGGIHPGMRPGDIIIATDLVQHDFDLTEFGRPIGQIPGMESVEIATDKALSDTIFSQAEKTGHRVFKGTVVSGDQFISSTEKMLSLRSRHNAIGCEMEGAAIAFTAFCNGIPCAVIRSVSDNGDDNAGSDSESFTDLAVKNSLMTLRFGLKAL